MKEKENEERKSRPSPISASEKEKDFFARVREEFSATKLNSEGDAVSRNRWVLFYFGPIWQI